MDNNQTKADISEAAKLLGKLDDNTREQILKGVKCLLFVQDLAKLNRAEKEIKAAQVSA